MKFSPEELAACRDGTLFGSSRSDPVGIQFDWEVPHQARAPIVLRIQISRGAAARVLSEFAIDLGRLQTDDLQTLHDLLAFPPKGYQLVRAITWLLDVSFRQGQPYWSAENKRNGKQ